MKDYKGHVAALINAYIAPCKSIHPLWDSSYFTALQSGIKIDFSPGLYYSIDPTLHIYECETDPK